ncbi:hypothetical protein SDJN03_30228, partial [Cucurbita argyrosperma subsp. sororia]
MKRWELGDARAGFASQRATGSMGHASLTTTAQRSAATKASPEATVLGSVTAAFALGTPQRKTCVEDIVSLQERHVEDNRGCSIRFTEMAPKVIGMI